MERKTDEIPLTLEWHFTHERFSYSFSKSRKRFSKTLDCELLFIAAHSKGGEEGVIATRGRSVQRGEALGKEFKSCRCGGASSPIVATRRRRLISAADDGALQQPGNQPDEHTREPLLPLPLVSQGEFCHINAAGRIDGNHAAHTHLPNFCLFFFFSFFFPETRVQMKCFLYFILSNNSKLWHSTAIQRQQGFFVFLFFFLVVGSWDPEEAGTV